MSDDLDDWVPHEDDRVRWSRDSHEGRTWRVVEILDGDPPRVRIVPEHSPGLGVVSSEARDASLDELERYTQ